METMSVLDQAVDYLHERVAPSAQKIDADPEALRAGLSGLCERGFMGMRCPTEYGGPAVSEAEFRRFQEEGARTSGALAFLQTQHQSAVSMLSKSENEALKAEYLPQMVPGKKLVGIGFSQLRRGGPPIMRAKPCEGGYLLEGSVPWITGFGFYPEFLVGASLPDSQAVFAIVPFTEHFAPAAGYPNPGTIRFSEPMRLAAMESAMTVSGEFADWFVPEERVVFIQRASWIKDNDLINIALQGHFAIGCALAGLDILKSQAENKGLEFLSAAHEKLSKELEECREQTIRAQEFASQTGFEETTHERLQVRAWAIDLAVRCAHAAVTASSGAANSIEHPAQRVYREALVYTVSAQTTPIMEATLRRLTR